MKKHYLIFLASVSLFSAYAAEMSPSPDLVDRACHEARTSHTAITELSNAFKDVREALHGEGNDSGPLGQLIQEALLRRSPGPQQRSATPEGNFRFAPDHTEAAGHEAPVQKSANDGSGGLPFPLEQYNGQSAAQGTKPSEWDTFRRVAYEGVQPS